MEQRLIDATKLQGEMMDMIASGLYGLEDMIDAVIEQPTVDAVPVRCRDCKWFKSGIDINGKPFTRCDGSVRTYGHTSPDWYCADGERRNDDD